MLLVQVLSKLVADLDINLFVNGKLLHAALLKPSPKLAQLVSLWHGSPPVLEAVPLPGASKLEPPPPFPASAVL